MMSTKAFIAGLLGGVLAFIMGGFIFGFLLNDFIQGEMTADIARAQEDIIWWAMILGHLCVGFLFAYIYERHTSIRSFSKGALVGAVIGLFMAGIFNFIDYGSLDTMTLTGELVDLLVVTIVSGVVGGFVAFMLGRSKQP